MDQPKLPYVVFSRGDSPSLWVRFSIPGQGQKRICLKTFNEEKAKRRAGIEYQRSLWSAEQGTLPGRTSFDKIARQYLEAPNWKPGAIRQSSPRSQPTEAFLIAIWFPSSVEAP